jgi:hypothetical protein
MRIMLIAATASLCLLAGCNRGAGNNSANAAAPAANTAAPAANAAAPAASAAHRENEITECSADMARRLPAGADVAAFCGCAVDRIAAGARQNDAVNQCATEQHVTLQGGEAPAGGAEEGNTAE